MASSDDTHVANPAADDALRLDRFFGGAWWSVIAFVVAVLALVGSIARLARDPGAMSGNAGTGPWDRLVVNNNDLELAFVPLLLVSLMTLSRHGHRITLISLVVYFVAIALGAIGEEQLATYLSGSLS